MTESMYCGVQPLLENCYHEHASGVLRRSQSITALGCSYAADSIAFGSYPLAGNPL